ncbi:MAG TPA: LamG domain-containing protein [Paludibacter sp.]|nr:LamG domain-containing protein [Paludibacter sp.]
MSTYYKVSLKNTKKILLTFLMFLGISVASSADESLMLHFTFDEADISAGVLTDVTGNGFDALLSPDGNVTAVEGRTGDAAFFATVADYAQLPDNFIASLTSFTISTWVKIESRNMWCRISDFGSGTAYNIFLTPHGGSSKIRFALKNGGGEELVDGVQCPVGQWVHIAVVLDYDESESKGILKLYMDGGLVGTNPNVTICPAMLPESNQNYLGKSQYADPALNGAIDDYRIYNRALSDLEILVLAGVPDELTSALQALDADFIKKDNASLQNVTSDLNLPTAMEDYPEVAIEWSSNGTALVDTTGTVVLPEKYPAAVNLKATLTQTDATGKVHTLTKEFLVDLYPGGDEFWEWENYEIARWDFSSGSLSVNEGVINVTDLSENEFVGTVMNTARIRTIGETERFNVLDLGPDNGYFDMGEGIGEVMYALSDEFTM